MQTQELYDKLKRRAMLGQVQNAASDAVDYTIQASVAGNRFNDQISNGNQRQRQPPLFSAEQGHHMQSTELEINDNVLSETTNLEKNISNEGWKAITNHGNIQRQ